MGRPISCFVLSEISIPHCMRNFWQRKENTLSTNNAKIYRAQVREYDYNDICSVMNPLIALAIKVDKMGTVQMMKGIVPEFKSKNSEYEVLDKK